MNTRRLGITPRLAKCLLSVGAVALAVALVAVLAASNGCSSRESAGGKPVVALVMKSLANDFFKTMEEGTRKHQAAHTDQYELVPIGMKNEIDLGEQVKMVETMISRKVSAIVIAPADSKALVPVCRKAMEAGIVVINIDNKFDADALKDQKVAIPFMGPDNRKGARLAGDYLATRLKKGDKVAIVEGIPSAFNGIQRRLGFEDAMAAAGIVVAVTQSGRWEMAEAEKVVAGMITQTPDLKAILCANDSMALGAVAALRAANKLDQVLVVGFDNIQAVQDLMKEGKVLCTVDQHAGAIAIAGIEGALEKLKTHVDPPDRETPVEVITADKLK